MITNEKKIVSPSRRYVAICNRANFDGHYFRKFTLPKEHENNAQIASWYFLNRLDGVACIDGIITEEDFGTVLDLDQYHHAIQNLLEATLPAGQGAGTYVRTC